MRRTKASTSAMEEFQRVLDYLSYDLKLVRTGKFWELQYMGEDYGMSEAQVAQLAADTEDYGYRTSFTYGAIKIDPRGAIRSFDFGHRFDGRSVFEQLFSLFERIDYSVSHAIVDVRIDVRPNGNVIDVDVIAVEDYSGYTGSDDVWTEQQFSKIVGRFAYDPARQLLLHRTA